jgi:rare lipoprotein A
MGRWLVILSLTVAQYPASAMASSKSPDLPLWKRLLSSFTPATKPPKNAQSQASMVMAKANSSESTTGSQGHEPPKKPAGADAGCNGGQRIISAFYWQGQRTASGELFNPQAMTAAHRTLPFGTRLTVANPRTGKSVVVVVNDRGPFVSGVGLDLSLGAAKAIGMQGTGAVCIQ